MEKAKKLFKCLGWFMMAMGLIMVGFQMIFDAFVLIPLSLSLTAGAVFMFISMTIEIIGDLLNGDED